MSAAPESGHESGHESSPDDLALHGVRVLGFPTTERVAERFHLDAAVVEESLLDFEAVGWVRQLSFGGSAGWSLTDPGRVENERRLAAELDRVDARATVMAAHATFRPLNERFGGACTDWQVRPTAADPMALNDHSDWRWDERVLRTLASIDDAFRQVCDQLTGCLSRFAGYADLYTSARRRVEAGQRAWVDAPDRDSCHIVWIQFHEDLLATLGLARGSDT
jgi:hypothetical protein